MEKKLFIPQDEKTHDISDIGESRSVLLLDDEADFNEMLKSYLEGQNFQVTCVPNGAEGFKKVLGADFDVIVCDMMMPHLPGDMFYLAVQKTKPHLCSRFIFITGHKGDPKIDEFIRSVKGLIVYKPVKLHELMEAIHLVVQKNAKTAKAGV